MDQFSASLSSSGTYRCRKLVASDTSLSTARTIESCGLGISSAITLLPVRAVLFVSSAISLTIVAKIAPRVYSHRHLITSGRCLVVPIGNQVDVLPALKDGASTTVFPSPIEGSGTTRV